MANERTQTFFLEVTRIKNEKVDFLAYKGFPEPKQHRIDVKFRKDVKNVPQTSGYITVKLSDLSVDRRKRYPVLWIANFESFDENNPNQSNKSVEELFS